MHNSAKRRKQRSSVLIHSDVAWVLSMEVVKSGIQTYEKQCGCLLFKVTKYIHKRLQQTNKCSACILLPECYLLQETSEHLHFMQVKLNLNIGVENEQIKLYNFRQTEEYDHQKSLLLETSEGNFIWELLLIQSFHYRNAASFPHLYFLRLPRIHPRSSAGKHHSTAGLMPGSKLVMTRKIMFIALPHVSVREWGHATTTNTPTHTQTLLTQMLQK